MSIELIPGRASDAGPESGRFSEGDTLCCDCGHNHVNDRALRCQGAMPDLCMGRMCANCETKCWSCGLTACAEHRTKAADGWECQFCATVRTVITQEACDEFLA